MIRTILALAAATALAACASPRATSTTTLTAAEARDSEPAAREATPETAPAAPAAAVPAPAGQLVCRTKDAFGVTSELFLEWKGDAATGVIRSTAPSGVVSERRVRGERYKDTIVLDDPGQTDLVTHAAVLRSHAGKQHVRLADAGDAWSACE